MIAHLAERFTLSGSGSNWVELWWKLTVDGERCVQHQVVYIDELDDGLSVLIDTDVHCLDPERVDWDVLAVSVGALGFDGGRPVLWQPVIGKDLDPAHLERVMQAVAYEAAQLARHARLAAA